MSALILNVSSCDIADLVVVKIGQYRNQKRSSFIHYSFLIEFISQVIDLDWNREVILDVIFEDVVLSVLDLKCKMKTIFYFRSWFNLLVIWFCNFIWDFSKLLISCYCARVWTLKFISDVRARLTIKRRYKLFDFEDVLLQSVPGLSSSFGLVVML